MFIRRAKKHADALASWGHRIAGKSFTEHGLPVIFRPIHRNRINMRRCPWNQRYILNLNDHFLSLITKSLNLASFLTKKKNCSGWYEPMDNFISLSYPHAMYLNKNLDMVEPPQYFMSIWFFRNDAIWDWKAKKEKKWRAHGPGKAMRVDSLIKI